MYVVASVSSDRAPRRTTTAHQISVEGENNPVLPVSSPSKRYYKETRHLFCLLAGESSPQRQLILMSAWRW